MSANLSTSGSSNKMFVVEASHTIHPRATKGRHMRWRWALVWLTQLLFYGLPWLTVNGQPALWLDLEGVRFFLFGSVFFPQDLIWLTVLLIGSALLLFFATILVGRVWCGFACPQTVYTALFGWIEYRCEGDRMARQRLDKAPWRPQKLLRRGGKHILWASVSLWTGLTLVGYFTPIRALVTSLPLNLGPWETFWVLFYGLATYGNAGYLREKVCLHMCPYGRFQGALMDAQTLNVSYDARRGEPRGGRARSIDASSIGLGSCVDCTLCVQVCPTGVDIRQGLQSGCINCGLCIDACDTVMDKLEQPRGLIRFASLQELATPSTTSAELLPRPVLGWRVLQQLRRPRVALYASLLVCTGMALVIGVVNHSTLRMDAMRDRHVMSREVEGGAVENVYHLLLINASTETRTVRLTAKGEGLGELVVDPPALIILPPAQTQTALVRMRIPFEQAQAHRGAMLPVVLQATTASGSKPVSTQAHSTFMVPK